MPQKFTNAARSTLTAGISAAATSITLDVPKADLFPVANTGTDSIPSAGKDWFKVVIEDNTGAIEIVYVRTRAAGASSLTDCLRGQEGTTARAYLAGSIVELRHTAADLSDAISFATSASTFWKSLVGLANAALSRTALGISVVGDALFTAASVNAARSALGLGSSDTPTFAALFGITHINGGQLGGLRNLLINGNFQINERAYVSGAATAGANQYTLDRWRVVVSGQSLTFAASGNGNSVTAPAGGVEQVIEGVNVGGGTYVLNWTGTATATVNGTARAKGESFTLPANTNATVRLIGGTASLVQLEPGTTPTPFEYGPLWLEEVRCQRYCQAVTGISASGYQNSGSAVIVTVGFKVRMRASPTVIITNNGSLSNSSSTPVYAPRADGFGFGVVALATGPTSTTGAAALATAEL